MTTLRKSFIVIISSLIFLLPFPTLANENDGIRTWDISATDDDSVTAVLYERSDGEYKIEIGGNGKMKDFSDSDLPPWFEYADSITYVEICGDVENLGHFSFNYCFSLEKIVIKRPNPIFSTTLFPIPYETQIYAHENSSIKSYCSVFRPERFSPICEYEESVCTVCDYECTLHTGGESTCESGAKCDICGTEYTARKGHDFGDLLPEIPATCTKMGTLAHYECSVCGELKDSDGNILVESELVISAKHVFGDLIPYSPPECTKSGVKEHYHCEVCGENFDKNSQPIADIYISENDHSGGVATCTSGAICKDCGVPYGEVDSENHSFSTTPSYDASAHWYACKCGETRTLAEHAFSSRIIIPPTEEEEGTREFYCFCGYKYEENIPKIPLSEQDPQNTTPTDKSVGDYILPISIITVSALSVAIIVFILVRKLKK